MESKELKEENYQEKILKARNGVPILFLNILAMIGGLFLFIFGISHGTMISVIIGIIGLVYTAIIGPIMFNGIKSLKNNEALVLTLFGKYYGTLKGEGFYFVNPFNSAFNPAKGGSVTVTADGNVTRVQENKKDRSKDNTSGKKISLKLITLNNEKQKVNDKMGNPIEIGVVVIWRVLDTAKAVYNVDNYMEFLSIQADSALRNIVRLYPYDIANRDLIDDNDDNGEMSLRGSSSEVAEKLKEELQGKVNIAGLEITEAKITHLAYAPEIAAAMLQRQQASAIIDARKLIVKGAVDIVQMALDELSSENVVELDEERKAQMVSNLLVVLCGNKDAQPIVNSGSIY